MSAEMAGQRPKHVLKAVVPSPPKKAGELVRELRIRRGMTQGQLAAEIGVSNVLISNIEAGKRLISPVTGPKLEQALGTGDGYLRMAQRDAIMRRTTAAAPTPTALMEARIQELEERVLRLEGLRDAIRELLK